MQSNYSHLKSKVREILNFPKPGINFYDITPLLEDPKAFQESIDSIVDYFKNKKVNRVIGIDARGFLIAAPVAYLLGAGLVVVRKKGKLPSEIIVQHHILEYGKGRLEIHTDAIKKDDRVVVIDDLLATGGTAEAAVKLTEALGGEIIGLGFLIELASLDGRKRFNNYDIYSMIKY